ncbi:DUF4214 domain-containing protein [Rhizobium oryzicola]|uniref:DUF4214 domain-containing protein n=1 Tax=Rhizobium oryzicola TaxID=1232668 RepID=A0ABT8T2U0_9HYPH|nr:DUF4214 domain-containing protein [Rhizobium oryzicola]MDO1584598.1 DUF4214 domain-containing protein [Rhizobium oryzicola]
MAATLSEDQVQKLYIAYFGRPADPVGLKYWSSQLDAGVAVAKIAATFSSTQESIDFYRGTTDGGRITAIYQNLFGRAPEPAGLQFWSTSLSSGKITIADAVVFIMNAAASTDATIVSNKVQAANAFTANIDTPDEIKGYSGAKAAETARAFLSKIDATPQSIANLAADANKAVADASSTNTPVPPVVDTTPVTIDPPPPPPVFSVSKDGSGLVTFANAGSSISIAATNGGFSFTTNGSAAGTAAITGSVSSIAVPAGSTLTISSGLANGLSFPGSGTVKLSDTGAVTAATLKTLDAATTGLLDATGFTSITSASATDAQLLLVTNQGTSGNKIKTAGNVAVTLTDTTAAAGVLKAIEGATTGLVDASTVKSLVSASAADAQLLLLTNQGATGDKIKMAGDVTVTLTDTTATAATLKSIEAATTGLVDASTVESLVSASAADAQLLLVTNQGTTGDKIKMAGDVAVTLADTTATAATLKSIEGATTGLVDASSVTSLTSASAADAQLLLVTNQGATGNKIKMAGDVTITLTDTSIASSTLKAIDGATTGLITAANLTDLSGATADIKSVLTATTTGTAIAAAALNKVTLADAITTHALDTVTFVNNTTIKLANVTGNALTLLDSTVAAGKTLTLDATAVASAITLDGSAETNGRLFFSAGAGATLKGGAGGDTFDISGRPTLIDGGAGNDILNINVSGQNLDLSDRVTGIETININGGDQDSSVIVPGGSLVVNVRGGAGALSVTLGAGGQTIKVLSGGAGVITIKGGAGADTIQLPTSGPPGSYVIDETGSGLSNRNAIDTVYGFNASGKSVFKTGFQQPNVDYYGSDSAQSADYLNKITSIVNGQNLVDRSFATQMELNASANSGVYLFQNTGPDVSSFDDGDFLVKLLGTMNLVGTIFAI